MYSRHDGGVGEAVKARGEAVKARAKDGGGQDENGGGRRREKFLRCAWAKLRDAVSICGGGGGGLLAVGKGFGRVVEGKVGNARAGEGGKGACVCVCGMEYGRAVVYNFVFSFY